VAAAPVTAAPPPQPVAAAVAAVEKPLIAVRQDEPALAGPLARERPTGVVQVGFNVNTDGSTGDVSVVSSSNRKLNSAVVNAVSKWVYKPLDTVRRVEVAIEFKND
jgi:TonB family protein